MSDSRLLSPLASFVFAGTAAFVCFATVGGVASAEPVTLRSLLGEMDDLGRLAEKPDTPYLTLQASSYNRNSVEPDDGSDTEQWYANQDFGQYLRTETIDGREERVLMEHDGPGAIVRLWSANPVGTLRVYLDGDDEPAIEADLEQILAGSVDGFPEPLAGVRGRGYTLWFPIPFAESCKVTLAGSPELDRMYYLLNYRAYPEGTAVETFDDAMLADASSAVTDAARALAGPAQSAQGESTAIEAQVAAGDEAAILERSGAGRITELSLRLEAEDLPTALRQTLLVAEFDGKRTVEVPVGDFFGAAPGVQPYQSLPMTVAEDGTMTCRFAMPFAESARLSLKNLGEQDVRASGEAHLANNDGGELLFHATYHGRFDVPTRPFKDLTLVDIDGGSGRFVGLSYAIDNPVAQWWGEGDEKIYVDAERDEGGFPSWFGTGTEDYFSYAWCDNEVFGHAYHNQPLCWGPQNYGRSSVNRFQVIDDIPFEDGLRFDMELWHWRGDIEVNVATVAYWYGEPGTSDISADLLEAKDVELRPLDQMEIPMVAGAIEGEDMRLISRPDTTRTSRQEWAGLSGLRHLWWHEKPEPGDRLILEFDAPTAGAGEHELAARFLSASDYGVVDLYVNGKQVAEDLDLYRDRVEMTEETSLGTVELKPAGNRIEVVIKQPNPDAKPGNMFGLDYVRVVETDD